ncbi:MAG: hypothetical protein GY830_07865 [Bacteroidetes bacterium]|nr:hypothetical protein [Bacteroidota bacterium]
MDEIYTEEYNDGSMKRVYMETDGMGNAKVLASEHRLVNGDMRLLTYDYNSKEEGVKSRGKVYLLENGKYTNQAAGQFVIKEVLSATGMSGVGKKLMEELGLGSNARIVYQETMNTGAAREISINRDTGALEYVHTQDSKGNQEVVVFSDKVSSLGSGVKVKQFSKLDKKEQNDILASLPVMNDKDPAMLTSKLVSMQDELKQAQIMKLAKAKGWSYDSENNTLTMDVAGTKLGMQVLRMGEDKDGKLIIQGRELVDRGGKLEATGAEIWIADADSSFGEILLKGQDTSSFPIGAQLIAIVKGAVTNLNIIDSDQKNVMKVDVGSNKLTLAVKTLKGQSQSHSIKNKNIINKVWDFMKNTWDYSAEKGMAAWNFMEAGLKFVAKPINAFLRSIGGQGSLDSNLVDSVDEKFNKVDNAIDSLVGNKQKTNKSTDNNDSLNRNTGTTFDNFMKNKNTYIQKYKKEQDKSWRQSDNIASAINQLLKTEQNFIKIDGKGFKKGYEDMENAFKNEKYLDSNKLDMNRKNIFTPGTDELNVYVIDEEVFGGIQIKGSYDKKVVVNSEDKRAGLQDHFRVNAKKVITKSIHILISLDNLSDNSLKAGVFYGFSLGSFEVGGELENKRAYANLNIRI